MGTGLPFVVEQHVESFLGIEQLCWRAVYLVHHLMKCNGKTFLLGFVRFFLNLQGKDL